MKDNQVSGITQSGAHTSAASAALRLASAASVVLDEPPSPPPSPRPRVRGGPPTTRLLLGIGAVGLSGGAESSRRPGPAKLSLLDSFPQSAPIAVLFEYTARAEEGKMRGEVKVDI